MVGEKACVFATRADAGKANRAGEPTFRVAFVSCPVEVLGGRTGRCAREVLRPDLPALLLTQADQGLHVLPHDDAGVGPTDEDATVEIVQGSR